MSPWLVRVGKPVLGPMRWTSMITTGISAKWAMPTNSDMSEMPGPGGGRQRPCAGPAGADGHADGRQLVLGLDDGERSACRPG